MFSGPIIVYMVCIVALLSLGGLYYRSGRLVSINRAYRRLITINHLIGTRIENIDANYGNSRLSR
jgi:hypothetical protein